MGEADAAARRLRQQRKEAEEARNELAERVQELQVGGGVMSFLIGKLIM